MASLLLVSMLAATVAEAKPIKCLTPEFLALRDAPFDQARFFRPSAAGFVDSAIYPLRVHYGDLADADRALLVILPMVEATWAAQVDVMGWPAPVADAGVGGNDSLDVYLTQEGTFFGAYTFGFGPDVVPDDDWYTNAAYIAIDDRIDDLDMTAYVAHEFNHVMHYAIDATERTLFVWEATAEAITDIVYDDTDYLYELYSFQQLPFMSLLFDSYNPLMYAYGYTGYYYEYGGMLFTTYIEEKYGTKDGTLLVALWDNLGQPTNVDEPDFLDAVALVDPTLSVAAIFTDFSVWRMFAATRDDGAHYEEGATFPDYAMPLTEDTLDLTEVDGYTASPVMRPYDISASYYFIDLGAGTDQTLHVEVAGDVGTQWGIAWAVWQTAGGPAVTGSTWVADGLPLSVDIELLGGYQAEIGVVNAGPEGLDPNLADPIQRDFTLSLTLLDAAATGDTGTPPTGDTDVPPTTGGDTDVPEPIDEPTDDLVEEKPGGCACDSAADAPVLLLSVGVALVALRRKRSWQTRAAR